MATEVRVHSGHFICRLGLGQEHLPLHQHPFLLHLLLKSLIIFELMVAGEEVCIEGALTLLTHEVGPSGNDICLLAPVVSWR